MNFLSMVGRAIYEYSFGFNSTNTYISQYSSNPYNWNPSESHGKPRRITQGSKTTKTSEPKNQRPPMPLPRESSRKTKLEKDRGTISSKGRNNKTLPKVLPKVLPKDKNSKGGDLVPKGKSPKESITRKAIPKNIRLQTWESYHGNLYEGTCYACGRRIDNENWHCSHVISDKRGGTQAISNLRTCCQHCNLSCGEQNLYAFIRDKGLKGPGAARVNNYMRLNPLEKDSKR